MTRLGCGWEAGVGVGWAGRVERECVDGVDSVCVCGLCGDGVVALAVNSGGAALGLGVALCSDFTAGAAGEAADFVQAGFVGVLEAE